MHKIRGFTLLEILVVILISGLLSTLVIVSFNRQSADQLLADEAAMLSALVGQACREALLQSRNIGLLLGPDGYQFMLQVGSRWQPVLDPASPWRPRPWREVQDIRLTSQGYPVKLDSNPGQPSVICLANGELLPFELRLFNADHSEISLQGFSNSQVQLRERQS